MVGNALLGVVVTTHNTRKTGTNKRRTVMRSPMWFQHDGAPDHYSIDVRLHLNATYGQQWIGRGGPVLWPLDRQTSLALITSYGGTSSHWCTKLPLTVLRTLLHASRFRKVLVLILISSSIFSRTFVVDCAVRVLDLF
ncbi:hypothetical protein AVEN_161806-1 [Araneus ventricosus]|uniref:Uncharacterized protein n=1 Tax=Araneus ventricosus TaxID=182803 RepID=A0A4Y2ERY7_ARAVE|nr:hypothetical protein AVEN_161806-1 [Araneus ventricosus]